MHEARVVASCADRRDVLAMDAKRIENVTVSRCVREYGVRGLKKMQM